MHTALKPLAITTVCAAIALSAGCAHHHPRHHHRADWDNNPPGWVGGPGTNWENPPGPRGGPGTSPNRRRWW